MGVATATVEQIDQAINYEFINTFRTIKGSVWITPFGSATVHEFEGRCDHETCYETHDTRLVFSLGNRYFLKTGTYDSSDGLQWTGPLREVKPTEKIVQDWADVPAYVWDLDGINKFLNKWMSEQDKTRWGSSYDWVKLYYAAADDLDIAGFPWTIKAVEEYAPGEPESNGPVWLIFEINGLQYAAKGRNISHCGLDFESVYGLELVEKKTVTMEVWH
jgi:hypothetical protein